MLPPLVTLALAVLVMLRLALNAVTLVLAVLLLFVVTGSAVLLLTVAVLLTLVATVTTGAVATIVTVALAALARLPRLQVTVVVPEQVPTLGVAETKIVPVGRVSVTTTLLALSEPALLTLRV